MIKKEQERQEAIEELRGILTPGITVYTVLRHVSSSGMSRLIDCYTFEIEPSCKLWKRWLTPRVARALGWKFDTSKESMRVHGCGMDMGFHTVSTLSRVLYPDGCDGEKIGSTRHVAPEYVLNQEWI